MFMHKVNKIVVRIPSYFLDDTKDREHVRSAYREQLDINFESDKDLVIENWIMTVDTRLNVLTE